MKKAFTGLLISFFSLFVLNAQQTAVDFYGVYSASGDKNMIEMTRNLYFAQLKEMESIVVTDKSGQAFFTNENGKLSLIPKEAETKINSIQFFIEIESSGSGSWQSILHLQDNNSIHSITTKQTYSSYYKILTEAKTAIEDAFVKYNSNFVISNQKEELILPEETAIPANTKATTESLAGTWQGENFIDKIVILRGGRGFIIYKNGATMNIQVSVQANSDNSSIISITQAGKSNASFFPELPRKTALENAPIADPLEWNLTLTDSNTLQGSKKTLLPDESSPTGAIMGTSDVTWVRK